jgi:predicted NAD/FAD-dependent oxidoreductase
MTGAAAASMLSDCAAVNVSVWEKNDRVGGRMAEIVSPLRPACFVEAGAQYVSKSRANRFR